MKKRKWIKYLGITLIVFIMIIFITLVIASVRLNVKTNRLSDDYEYLYEDSHFK